MLKTPQKFSHLKIIAGHHRSRLIEFPDTKEIRPTPNRVRETLFNWLMERIRGAHCLDAFAGSGALAFEAISRGAESVTALEQNPNFAKQIQQNAKTLALENLQVLNTDFFSVGWTKRANASVSTPPDDGAHYDLVFIDPPFQQNLLPKALAFLMEHALLAKDHRIYFEVEKEFDLATLPPEVEILKNQVAGQVRYGLLQVRI